MLKKILKELLRPAYLLAVLFLCFIVFVGAIAIPPFLINTGKSMEDPLNLLRYIQTVNGQYSGMLETDASLLMPHDKGSYIDLNGFMANALGQSMMNNRVKLKNGHLASLDSEDAQPEVIRTAADNIIRFYDFHKASDGDFLFFRVASAVTPQKSRCLLYSSALYVKRERWSENIWLPFAVKSKLPNNEADNDAEKFDGCNVESVLLTL